MDKDPIIIIIGITSRWIVPRACSRTPPALRLRAACSRRQARFNVRVTYCVTRVRLGTCVGAIAGCVPDIYITTVSAASQQTCLHVNVRQFQVERSQNEIRCSAPSQQSRCCRRVCERAGACARLPVILRRNTILPSNPERR